MARFFNYITPDYYDCGDILHLTSALTYCAWVNFVEVFNIHTIISHGTSGPCLRVNAVGKLEFLKSNVAILLTGATTLVAGRWYHIAATYDSSGSVPIALYLNGISDASGVGGGTFSYGGPHLTIGTDFSGGQGVSANAMSGSVADAAVFNLALTANEMLGMARGARPYQIRSGPSGYWPLDGLVGAEPDLSGGKANGTATGTPSLSTGPPVTLWTPKARGAPLIQTSVVTTTIPWPFFNRMAA